MICTTLSSVVPHHPSRIDSLIVPVPEVYVYCHDTSIIGSSFYIMEFMNGRICTDPSLQDQFSTPYERQQAYQHVIHVLALIHTIDLSPYMDYHMLLHGEISGKSVGNNKNNNVVPKPTTISEFKAATSTSSVTTARTRKKRNFIERQLFQLATVSQRQSIALTQQRNRPNSPRPNSYGPGVTDENISKMMQPLDLIMKDLQQFALYCPGCSHPNVANYRKSDENVMSSTNEAGKMLIHGDYKIDNIIFHPTLPKVIAIIDWELASIHYDGVDPYCDVANLCMMYFIPKQTGKGTKSNDSNTTVITGIADYSHHELQQLGVPQREELIRLYCIERDQLLAIYDSYPHIPHVVSSSLRRHDHVLIYDWSGYYLTFLFFKNCIILQGVLQRTLQSSSSTDIPHNPSSSDEINIDGLDQKVQKKILLLLRLLPITINLATEIWKLYPPPSLCNITTASPPIGGVSHL